MRAARAGDIFEVAALSHDDAMRGELPSGTVTFLFTDIEGSTRLIEELGEEGYVQALSDHRRLLREAFAAQGGVCTAPPASPPGGRGVGSSSGGGWGRSPVGTGSPSWGSTASRTWPSR